MLGVLQRGFCQLGAAQHAGHFLLALGLVQLPNRSVRASGALFFLDQKMLIRKGGNLWQVRDAEHLLRARQRL